LKTYSTKSCAVRRLWFTLEPMMGLCTVRFQRVCGGASLVTTLLGVCWRWVGFWAEMEMWGGLPAGEGTRIWERLGLCSDLKYQWNYKWKNSFFISFSFIDKSALNYCMMLRLIVPYELCSHLQLSCWRMMAWCTRTSLATFWHHLIHIWLSHLKCACLHIWKMDYSCTHERTIIISEDTQIRKTLVHTHTKVEYVAMHMYLTLLSHLKCACLHIWKMDYSCTHERTIIISEDTQIRKTLVHTHTKGRVRGNAYVLDTTIKTIYYNILDPLLVSADNSSRYKYWCAYQPISIIDY
jgi:hypothetical protein